MQRCTPSRPCSQWEPGRDEKSPAGFFRARGRDWPAKAFLWCGADRMTRRATKPRQRPHGNGDCHRGLWVHRPAPSPLSHCGNAKNRPRRRPKAAIASLPALRPAAAIASPSSFAEEARKLGAEFGHAPRPFFPAGRRHLFRNSFHHSFPKGTLRQGVPRLGHLVVPILGHFIVPILGHFIVPRFGPFESDQELRFRGAPFGRLFHQVSGRRQGGNVPIGGVPRPSQPGFDFRPRHRELVVRVHSHVRPAVNQSAKQSKGVGTKVAVGTRRHLGPESALARCLGHSGASPPMPTLPKGARRRPRPAGRCRGLRPGRLARSCAGE